MKAKFMLFISVAVMYCTFLCGCQTSKNMDKTIPYEVAERYFIRNDVNGLPPTTQGNRIKIAMRFRKRFLCYA